MSKRLRDCVGRRLRASQRYIVFQLLEDTLGLPPQTWRVLDESHRLRNLAEYEGELNATVELVEELIAIGATLVERLDGVAVRTFPRKKVIELLL